VGRHWIEYREKPGRPWESWAVRVGTKMDARRSALGLLASLQDEGYPRARVRVGGKAIRAESVGVQAAEMEGTDERTRFDD